jgi:hypothetical protein
MKRGITALIGLALAVGLVVTIVAGGVATEPVYTIAQVRAGLAHHPAAWVGRSVLVWARVMADLPLAGVVPPGTIPGLHLQLEPAWPHMSPVLWVRPQSPAPWIRPPHPAPWLAFLRRLPLLRRVLPGPQQGRWGVYTVYRVQILPPHRSRCAPTPCGDALLLDRGAVR